MKVYKQVFQYGNDEYTIETGGVARQATGSVMVKVKDTVILVTAVVAKEAREGADFFPLTVNYQEKMYAAGKIPGGFLRREGRPGDHETLTARLIDRPLRPLFPKGYHNEVQVVVTVLSSDPDVCPDVPAMIGASAAVSLSGAPFAGPIGCARIGYTDGQYILNPTAKELETSELDLVVAGTADAVLMVESDAKELPEDIMLGSVVFGHDEQQIVIEAINNLCKDAGVVKTEFAPAAQNESLEKAVHTEAFEGIKKAYQIHAKQERYAELDKVRSATMEKLVTDADDSPTTAEIAKIFSSIEKTLVRENILSGELRIDGRDTRTVRPIHIDTTFLPRVHGSAIFTRGETQAIVATTLGPESDSQIIDSMQRDFKERFMLQYNFPPYSVGECGMIGSPKRREIGHGNLARRALKAVMPEAKDFPYSLRVVSEITESNGSSSMASVCGGSLSMMDAGVPLKAPVAGVAMGLILEEDRFAVLTDILGDEDHLGDMDFKVAGSANGVTALQMDIKVTGITAEIMEAALAQAKEGRMHILGLMNDVIQSAKTELSKHAPRITTMKINPDKIREVIGKGGSVIRSITETTGVEMDLEDDGTIKIFAADGEAAANAQKMIEDIIAEAEIGQTYEGTVSRIEGYGAFVNILPGKDGLVHISQIMHERVANVEDHLKLGQQVKVKVLDIDRQGKIKLSMKEVETQVPDTSEAEPKQEGNE